MYMSAEGKNFYIGINRNIVECKWTLLVVTYCHHLVLIETLWNVNKDKAKADKVTGAVY